MMVSFGWMNPQANPLVVEQPIRVPFAGIVTTGVTKSEFLKQFLKYNGKRGQERKRFLYVPATVGEHLKIRSTSETTYPISQNTPSATKVPRNHEFEKYYKEQEIVSVEEWDKFMEFLRKPLPVSFRINTGSQFRGDIQSKIENDLRNYLREEFKDSGLSETIMSLPWYPGNLAWQTNFSHHDIRKFPALDRLHQFLKLENELGNISRQELVSMVPPLFLAVHPDHFVLDMCAAPGSKTLQLLDLMQQSEIVALPPDGMVVANDIDFRRCDLLIHRTKRICTANLIVTSHEGQCLPCLRLDQKLSDVDEKATSGLGSTQLLFDRVLCDVPCSGDGTLRKYPSIWQKWRSGIANGLHNLQVLLGMRGLTMLKVGGRMVYSTCSMNPIENEAVVAEILRRCRGSVRLLDFSTELPQLIRRPGLKKWKVFENGIWYSSYDEVPVSQRVGLLRTMFPFNINCTDNKTFNEVADLPLERCMRIMPHDQDTGAFFVAVFQKFSVSPTVGERHDRRKKEIPASYEVEEKSHNQAKPEFINDTMATSYDVATSKGDLEVHGADGSGWASKVPCKWRGFDPVVFLNDEALIRNVENFYGIDERFPLRGHLVLRNSDTSCPKRIYFISKAVKAVLELNSKLGELKISSVGVKMFTRQSLRRKGTLPCIYRISSAGLPIILPFISRQILHASLEDFRHLLDYKRVKFTDFADPTFGDMASNLLAGFCVVVLRGSSVAVGSWKGKNGLEVMCSDINRGEVLERLSRRADSGCCNI